jgi:quercetin dioxygenase-like cupin family protein
MSQGPAKSRFAVDPGRGEVARLTGLDAVFKLDGADTAGAFAIVEHPIAPRTLVRPHRHAREDEFSFVIEGEVGARVGEQESVVGPGAYVVKPRGVLHTFWNPTDRPARLLEIISPAGFERYFARLSELLSPALEGRGAPDVSAIGGLAEEYGLVYDMTWLPELVERYALTPPPG